MRCLVGWAHPQRAVHGLLPSGPDRGGAVDNRVLVDNDVVHGEHVCGAGDDRTEGSKIEVMSDSSN